MQEKETYKEAKVWRAYTHTHTRMYIHIYTYTHMYIMFGAHTYIYTRMYIHIYTHTHTRVCVQAFDIGKEAKIWSEVVQQHKVCMHVYICIHMYVLG